VQPLGLAEGVTAVQAVQLVNHGVIESITDDRARDTADTAAQDACGNETSNATGNSTDWAGDKSYGCTRSGSGQRSSNAACSSRNGANGAANVPAGRQGFKVLGVTLWAAERDGLRC
jgi:hypothetical protein